MGARGVAQKPRVVKAESWNDLPEILEPGVVYDVDGVMIRPRTRLAREEARAIARGVKEMARKQP